MSDQYVGRGIFGFGLFTQGGASTGRSALGYNCPVPLGLRSIGPFGRAIR
jgi:hypothetical protein